MLDAKIKTKINHSNAGVPTTESTDVRACVHCCPHFVFKQSNQHGHLEFYYICFDVV